MLHFLSAGKGCVCVCLTDINLGTREKRSKFHITSNYKSWADRVLSEVLRTSPAPKWADVIFAGVLFNMLQQIS